MKLKNWLTSFLKEKNSKVYYLSLNSSAKKGSTLKRIPELLEVLSFHKVARPKALTAIKMHFGERGNTAFIRPLYLQRIVDYLKEKGMKPFLTDSNTLYAGHRGNSVDHLHCALDNGFQYGMVHAPLIIADGMWGNRSVSIEINGDRIKNAIIGEAIADANAILCVSHFKGHEFMGFGGALKNMGMGCAAKAGKLEMHSDVKPNVNADKCIACGLCMEFCPEDAISMQNRKAFINHDKCIGCASCIAVCPNRCIINSWDASPYICMEKIAEYAKAAISCVSPACGFISFITNVSPQCDCYGFSSTPIIGDIGILSSDDPVALDQACLDFVNNVPWHPTYKNKPQGDKFAILANGLDGTVQLSHAEKIGLGNRKYELIEI